MSSRLAVIIACYNHAKYVGGTIESVLNQTRKPDRFLVIDDGSNDDSVEIIKRYADKGVELIVQENAGAHNTWNRAASMASEDCELISILNSDDQYEPQRFERCLPFLEKASDKDVVLSGVRMIDADDSLLPEDSPRGKWMRAAWSMGEDENLAFWEWMAMANFPLTSSNIIARRKYLLENPFRPYRFNHDYFFLASAAIRDRIELVNEPLLRYRVHPENNINSAPAPLLKEMLRMHLDLHAHLKEELEGDAESRRRFYEYMRASWNSVSAMHTGLLHVLFTQLAGATSEGEREALVEGLDESVFAELNDYPNKSLINEWQGGAPLHQAEGLAEKLVSVEKARKQSEVERKAARELARLRQRLLRSKWVGLGRALGVGKSLSGDDGKTAQEKLTRLKQAIVDSGWLKAGAGLGSSASSQLKQESGGDEAR